MYKVWHWLLFSFLFLSIGGCSSSQKYGDREPATYGNYPWVDYTYEHKKSGTSFRMRRGEPSEYDPGAPKNSQWVRLYGSAPKYRSYGRFILNSKKEKFRWMFGPMWYRGRLGRNQVKVFVVGQEGAQDENVSNRAFTGSTGTRAQKFLNHLGIYRSYLFMNTFVYTINGQLDHGNKRFKWMEQGDHTPLRYDRYLGKDSNGNIEQRRSVEDSPIVAYRHQLFDYMLEQNRNSVALFLGVGSGGKQSLATWVEARGGSCSPAQNLKNCDTSGMRKYFERKWKSKKWRVKNKILVVGVPHPGGANPNLGGAAAYKKIVSGFKDAATRIANFKKKNKRWLKPDSDEEATKKELIERMQGEFEYGHSSIPFRDFAFGTNWRMGQKGTTSNRWGPYSIQVFSQSGKYNNKSLKYQLDEEHDSGLVAQKDDAPHKLMGMSDRDVPYESPRYNTANKRHAKAYDPGPCGYQNAFTKPCKIARELMSWPDFSQFDPKPISHESFGHGPIYRGRLKQARILILADQHSHDDFFSARALTGETGQRLQKFLSLSGVGNQYAIIRTLPIDTLGLPQKTVKELVRNSDVLNTHIRILSEILKKNKTRVFITLGPVAKSISKVLQEKTQMNKKILKVHLPSPSKENYAVTWNKVGKKIAKTLKKKFRKYDPEKGLMTIAREDLPYHTRWWMGSSGNRAARGDATKDKDGGRGDYYRVYAPKWVKSWKKLPVELTLKEKKKVLRKMQKANLSLNEEEEEILSQ